MNSFFLFILIENLLHFNILSFHNKFNSFSYKLRRFNTQNSIESNIRDSIVKVNSDLISPKQAKFYIDNVFDQAPRLSQKMWIKLLDSCIKWKFIDYSYQIFKKMGELNVQCSNFQMTWLLTSLSDEGRYDDALETLETCISLGLNPSVQNFSPLLRSCDSIEKSRELLQRMESIGIEPNVISYTAAIKSCERLCDWKGALGTVFFF